MLSSLNIIPDLIDLLSEEDPATQRLAASALVSTLRLAHATNTPFIHTHSVGVIRI